MKALTFNDMIEMQKIEDEYEQQAFLLSRFFEKTPKEIKDLPMREVNLMMAEMSQHIEKGFLIENPDEEPITNRSEILDIR